VSELLSDDEKSYFMDMESLFNHPGWTRLTTEMRKELEHIPQEVFTHAKTWETILEARARESVLRTFVEYPDAIEQRRAALEDMKRQQIEEVSTL
jgi:hypothetical protein